MNKEEVIRLAREAGLIRTGDGWTEPYRWGMTEIERFADLVAAAEREECANLADAEVRNTAMLTSMPPQSAAAFKIAAAIRNRGKE